MRTRTIVLAVILSALLLPTTALCFETNQYDLPRQPLADIGAEVTEHVAGKLRTAVDKINAEILAKEKCLTTRPDLPISRECNGAEQRRLEYLRSEDAVAQAAFDQLGAGVIPFTAMGTWMDSHHFAAQPARYQTPFVKSIFILNPGVALTISPTVKLYGSEFGTDKVAHVFQQGYTYYKVYRRALAQGATPLAATEKAVRWGQKSERTFYGTLVAGVYSNGDLAANYAGLKFYQGLTQPSVIGGRIRPALLELHEGTWRFRNDAEAIVLKPFISDHFNEALNPSIFSRLLGWRWFIRRSVKKRSCDQWRQRYPDLSRSALEEVSKGLRLWHGEDYGFTDSDDFVTIANTCFE
ncbi:MAG: hypothetical protein QOK48_3097 [Blastocatellia bacterium]|jgi:hypothetical protein|nr:hypothetical protein [Blastocatellia bacterium]